MECTRCARPLAKDYRPSCHFPVVERVAVVWWGTQHFIWALLLVVLVHGLLALVSVGLPFGQKSGGFSYHDLCPNVRRNAAVFSQRNGFLGEITVLPALPPFWGFGNRHLNRIALFLATVMLLVLALWLGTGAGPQ